MRKHAFIIAVVIAASAIAPSLDAQPIPSTNQVPPQEVILSPREAIEKAADAAPAGVFAQFEMTIAAVGEQFSMVYLNSQEDYRDQRCLTVAISPEAQEELRERFGRNLEKALKGKTIRIAGTARRVRIDFIVDRKPTGKYYYQTHVNMDSIKQLIAIDSALSHPSQDTQPVEQESIGGRTTALDR